MFLATVIPQNASLSSLTTISNHWSTKQHPSSKTLHFLNKLDQLGHLPSNAILVTPDVSSLYTNIPHNEGIDACRHYLNTLDQSTSTVRTVTLCDLIRMIQLLWTLLNSSTPSTSKHTAQLWEHAWLHHTLTYSSLNLRQTHLHMRRTSHTPGELSFRPFPSWQSFTQRHRTGTTRTHAFISWRVTQSQGSVPCRKGSNSWTQRYKQTRRNLILCLTHLYLMYYISFYYLVIH